MKGEVAVCMAPWLSLIVPATMATKTLVLPPIMRMMLAILLILAAVSLIDDEIFLKSENAADLKSKAGAASWSHNATYHLRPETPEERAAIVEDMNYVEPEHQEDPATVEPAPDTPNVEPPKEEGHEDGLVSIVVNLHGDDLGTDLAHVAFAKMLQLDASNNYNVTTKFIPKLTRNTQAMLDCFPYFDMERRMDDEEFEARKQQQVEWLGDKAILLEPSFGLMEDGLVFLQEKLKDHKAKLGKLSLPFLYADQSILIHEIKYMAQLRQMMEIKDSCCTDVPTTNETVLFLDGRNDMTPNQTLAFLGDTTQVVLVATDDNVVAQYTNVLPHARVVTHTSPLSAYCLLRLAQEEIVGPVQSELMQWAAIFNTRARRRLYTTAKEVFVKDVSFKDEGDPRSGIVFEVVDEAGRVESVASEETPGSFDTRNKRTNVETIENTTNAEIKGTVTLPPLGTAANPVSLIIQLSGEMGNQLSKLAWGYGMKWWLEDDYNVTTKVVLRHQDHSKWIGAAASVKKCFPKLRIMNFEEANTEEFNAIRALQDRWVEDEKKDLLSPRGGDFEFKPWILKSLDALKEAMEAPDRPPPPENSNFTLPFFYTDIFGNIGDVNDRYFERLKDLFEFETNNPDCCKTRVDPDESVFHFRNFIGEMRKAWRLGFEESSANKTANELFGNLNAGDKIAITSRFPDKGVQEYVDQFKERGIEARVISGQSPEHDFCFLMSAEKEMAGMAMSTYSIWAGYLGNASSVKMYSVQSPSRVSRFGDTWHINCNLTNPEMQRRYSFPAIKSELQDEHEAKARDVLLRYRM
jgi:hypothetical protein